MNILRSKTTATAIALFLLLTIAATLVALPAANAHTPAWQIPTFAFVQAVPDPIGVGQSALVYMWVDKVPSGAALSNDIRFHNYQLTITDPDGIVTTQTWAVVQDPTSNQGYRFTPSKVGTYILNFTFPGQTYTWTGAYGNDTYLASSASSTLTVQQEQIAAYPTTPLPTEYWTRPIYGENSNWWTISSNWLGNGAPGYSGFGSSYNLGGNGEVVCPGDAVGPQTAHIMWTKPLQSGGVVGGNDFVIQGDTYFEGSAYQQRFGNPIIIDGKLYYTEPVSFSGPSSGPTDCVDLQTGKLIWSRTDVPALSFGYLYDVQDGNQHGVYPPILFAVSGGGFFGGGVTWRAFDADTGNPMFNVTNIPTGAAVLGVNGEHLRYVLNNYGNRTNPNYYLGQWNSSNLWYGQYSGASTSPSVIPPITDGSDPRMYDWNISVPYLNSVTSFTTVAALLNDMILCYNGSLPSTGMTFMGSRSDTPYTYFTINLNASKGAIGSILWKQTYNPPANNITVLEGGVDPVNRVFVEEYRETAQFVGYSIDTGQKLWTTAGQVALDYYGSPASGSLADTFAYGKLYSSAYGGILYCYDTKTGNLLWTYGNGGEGNSTDSGFEVPGHYPTFVNAIGNGIVYLVTTEHTPETPIYKGALARAVNATDGTEIWTLSSYTGEFMSMSYAIADGYATWFNGYDNQIYVVGRGPSALTVEAPKTSVELGRSLVISGTVMDISAGTKQDQQAADFPNGVPVASDASMKDWMGYVYQQKPLPMSFTGVEVTVDVLDSNGNYRNIGSATTDATGMFSLSWKPDIPGNFTVVATFQGTNGYWPSYSETSFVVDPAAPTPSPYPTVNLPPTEMYFAVSTIAIIIAIAIVALLILRKKP